MNRIQLGQALVIKTLDNKHRKVEPVVWNKAQPRKKDSFEVWMDRVGKTIAVLAVFFGAATAAAQAIKLLG